MNRGGLSRLTLEQLAAERAQLDYLFRSLRIGARPSERMEPLAEQEIAQIRQAIGPKHEAQGPWIFSEQDLIKCLGYLGFVRKCLGMVRPKCRIFC